MPFLNHSTLSYADLNALYSNIIAVTVKPIGPVITLNTVNSPLNPTDNIGKMPLTNFIGFSRDNIPVPAAFIPPEEPLAAPPVFQNNPGILDNPFLTEDIGLVNNIILAEYILNALLFLPAAKFLLLIF